MANPHHARRTPSRWLRLGIPALLVLVWFAAGSIGGPYFGKVDEVSTNDRSSFLPASADATQVNERLADSWVATASPRSSSCRARQH